MPSAKTSVTDAHSARAGKFEQAYEKWQDATLQLAVALDGDAKLAARSAMKAAQRRCASARRAVVDGLRQYAGLFEERGETHDRVAERIDLLSRRWAERGATAIEAPEKWDRGVWDTQYQFIAAVEESDAEAWLKETLHRFPADFVCVRKTRQPAAAVVPVAGQEPLSDAGRAVRDILQALPADKGLIGSKLVVELKERDIFTSESALTSRVIPELKQRCGLKNKPRIGYYLPK